MNVRRWAAPIGWAVIILVLTSIPLPAISAPAGTDKGVHALLYFILGFFALRALLAARSARVWQLLVLVIALLVFGALDEFHQRYIPGRTADPKDWAADATGSVVGIVAGIFGGRRASRRV